MSDEFTSIFDKNLNPNVAVARIISRDFLFGRCAVVNRDPNLNLGGGYVHWHNDLSITKLDEFH